MRFFTSAGTSPDDLAAMAATYTSTLAATVSGSLVPTATHTIVAPLAAPSGYVVDFEHPKRKGDVDGYWVHAFGIFFALGFLIMRIYVKLRVTPPLNWEDGKLSICIIWLSS